ncbi:MAG: hypothetical protein V7767_00525 [Leeuwenhoekiella sp.]
MSNILDQSIKGKIILTINSDSKSKDHFKQLARVKKWNLIDCESSINAIQYIKKNGTPYLLVIENDATPLDAFQTCDYLKQELNIEPPVAIIHSGFSENFQNRNNSILIEKPFSLEKLDLIEDFINKPQIAEVEKSYSLNYLNQLSDGDETFIISSLQIFTRSVEQKLAEITNLLKTNDYKLIGEIAHNIKPSFEMIESKIGKNLCNILVYDIIEDEVPQRVSELNAEFSHIRTQLNRDFPKLNEI